MDNPLDIWRKATSSPRWSTATPEEQAAIRGEFLSRYGAKAADDKASTALEFAIKDLKTEVFEDKRFQALSKDDQLKIIKANKIASGVWAKSDFAEGKINKANLDIFRTYTKEYLGGAKQLLASAEKGIVASTASTLQQIPDKSVFATGPIGALKGLANVYRGGQEGTQEFIRKTDAMNRRDKTDLTGGVLGEVTKRIPGIEQEYTVNRSDVAEIVPQAYALSKIPLQKAGGFLTKLLSNAGLNATTAYVTTPVVTKEGLSPEEESKAIREGKTAAAIAGGTLSAAGDVVTSPSLRQRAGNVGRWLQARLRPLDRVAGTNFGNKGKIGDIADDLLRKTAQEATETSTIAGVSSQVPGKKPTPGYVARAIGAEEARIQALPEGAYTGGNTGPIGTLQEGNPASATNQNTARLAQEATATSDVLTANAPQNTGQFAETAKKLKLQRNPVAAASEVLDLEPKIAEATKRTAKQINDVWKSSPILKARANVSREELLEPVQDILEFASAKDSGVTNIEVVNRIAKRLEESENISNKTLVDWARELRENFTSSNQAVLQRLVDVVEAPLGKTGRAEIDALYQRTRELDLNLKSELAGISSAVKTDFNWEKAFQSEPVYKAVATAKTPSAIVDSTLAPTTSREHITAAIKNPQTKNTIKTAYLMDFADTLNAATPQEKYTAFQTFYKKFAGKEDIVEEVFAGSPKAIKNFRKTMEIGKSYVERAERNFASGGVDKATGLAKLTKGGVQKAGSLPYQFVSGGAEAVAQFFNSETRKILNASEYDKKIALQIVGKAKQIAEGRVKYSDLYSKMEGPRKTAQILARTIAAQPQYSDAEPAAQPTPAPETPQPAAPTQEQPLTEPQKSDTIDTELDKVDIDPRYKNTALSFAGAESSHGKSAGKNPNSSAYGLLQFIDSTWKEAEQAIGRPLNKDSYKDQVLAGAWYAQTNANTLRENTLTANDENLYVAHHFGGAGAVKLLKGGTNIAYKLMGTGDVVSNPQWFFRKYKVVKVGNKKKLTDATGPYTAIETVSKIKDYYVSRLDESKQQALLDTISTQG